MPPTQKMAVCYIETVAEREGRFPAGLASLCSSLLALCRTFISHSLAIDG